MVVIKAVQGEISASKEVNRDIHIASLNVGTMRVMLNQVVYKMHEKPERLSSH